MATAPKPGANRKKQAEDASITVKLDGATYTMRMSEVSALDTSELRRSTGMSIGQAMAMAEESPDLDIAAVFVWLARRQSGEPKITYAEVAGGLNYASDFDLVDEDDAPEA